MLKEKENTGSGESDGDSEAEEGDLKFPPNFACGFPKLSKRFK